MELGSPDLLVRLGAYAGPFAAATGVTVVVTFVAMAAATLVGIVVAVLRFANSKWLDVPIYIYLAVIRNTPELVQLYLAFFALPKFGITLDPFPTAVLVLGLHYGAYLSEVFRGGIASLDRGQWEASAVLGMGRVVKWRYIILPQALGRVVPPWGNYLLVMFKATALTGAITVHELFFTAGNTAGRNFRFFEIYTIITIIYFILGYPTALLIRRLEGRTRPLGGTVGV